MAARQKIEVQGTEVALMVKEREDYISLTGIAKYRNPLEPFAIINNWMRNRSTIEFLGLWERLGNPNFKPLEFERFRMEAGNNYFVLSPQRWVEGTNAIIKIVAAFCRLVKIGQRFFLQGEAEFAHARIARGGCQGLFHQKI
jgi:hypothetical protein